MLKVQRLTDKAKLPQRATTGSAGYDLCSVQNYELAARARTVIATGITISIPRDCYARIAPRSSLAIKGIDVLAGVVDSDYQGEVKVVLINHGELPFTIQSGDRIAQLILEKIHILPVFDVVDDSQSHDLLEVRKGGFGSTD